MVFLCHGCIGDGFLKAEVKKNGTTHLCHFCGKNRKAQDIEAIGRRVETVVDQFYERHHDIYGADDGTPVDELIGEIAGVDDPVAQALRAKISERTSWTERDGGVDGFSYEACYRRRSTDTAEFSHSWRDFQEEIGTRARFFSKNASASLDFIFGDLDAFRSWDGKALKTVGPGTDIKTVFRARVALSDDELSAILKSPVEQLGPPPARLARAGRMNAKGISMFYGAVETGTCIAEVRPPVGSRVILGQFEIVRELRILDLDVLSNAYDDRSHFDPGFSESKARSAFLRRLVEEISSPIMPRDEEDGYLVTQAIAEYLATRNRPKLDGIIFRSSQTGGKGRNLVLFNGSCDVEPYSLPLDAEVEIDLHADWSDDDDPGYIRVRENVPAPAIVTTRQLPVQKVPWSYFDVDEFDRVPQTSVRTGRPGRTDLRLDVSSIEVRRIDGVGYDEKPLSMRRTREDEASRHKILNPTCFPYFAYGSNMSSDRLRFHVPEFETIGKGTLVGHVLRFDGIGEGSHSRCNAVEGTVADGVVGVLFRIPHSSKSALDRSEGLGQGYDDAEVNIIAADGAVVKAIAYFARAEAGDVDPRPSTWYKDFVVEGALEHGVPQDYIDEFISGVAAVEESDPAQDRERRAERAAGKKFRF